MNPEIVQLGQGVHLSPEDGVCLMEYVSIVAGEPFGPEPVCTEPSVALVAGLVNDLMSVSARDGLIDLVPRLVTARVSDRELTSLVVVSVTAEAIRLGGQDRRLSRQHVRARARLSVRGVERPAGVFARVAQFAYRRGGARHGLARAVAHVLRMPPDRRDAALRSLLESALDAIDVASTDLGVSGSFRRN